MVDSGEKQQEGKTGNKGMLWLKRLGFAGFMFFLIKGLIWIAIFVGVGKCAL